MARTTPAASFSAAATMSLAMPKREASGKTFVKPKSRRTALFVTLSTRMLPGCGSALKRPSIKIVEANASEMSRSTSSTFTFNRRRATASLGFTPSINSKGSTFNVGNTPASLITSGTRHLEPRSARAAPTRSVLRASR